ncbi:sulfatase [Bryobacterales bacterium F-183]|nr:sulfatase [Bryobacterales bacterium F-183]
MNRHWNSYLNQTLSRRELLRVSSTGFGSLALASMLHGASSADPMAVKTPHFKPRAKRVIFLFMHGGPSQVDTFDYKPLLKRDHGKPLPFARPKVVSGETFNLLQSPWAFKQYGQSGAWVSDLFPEVAKCVDDICFVKSMWGSNSRHGGALLELHTGSDTFIRPSMGSWVTYGLGSENSSMPGYLTICPTQSHGGANNFGSAFLPAPYAGTAIGSVGVPARDAKIPFITNTETPRNIQRMEIDYSQVLNRKQLETTGPDHALEGRIESFELAFRMQAEAPELQDLGQESEATRKLYGLDNPVTEDFGRQCLMARRFSEKGVRFVQVSHTYKWDQHANLRRDHEQNAAEVDKPIAGLLKDLKSRGLLEDTLVLWAGEFGRTPTAEGSDGRDHNPEAFTIWMAGGGVKPGFSYGATDDYGYYSVVNKVHFHDLHATILHLLGLDHKKLTYRFAGRDFRLTDVHGNVVHDIMA